MNACIADEAFRLCFDDRKLSREYLTAESFQHLCYSLLRRSAALQLAPQQRTYDQLLPFYCGDPKEPFDVSKVGAILIQVKVQKRDVFPRYHRRRDVLSDGAGWCLPGHSSTCEIPTYHYQRLQLLILFDLGSEQNSVEVSYSKASNPRIWAIHSKGHDDRVFACLNKMEVHPDTFFNCVKPLDGGTEIAFNHHKDHYHDHLTSEHTDDV
ncbi:hypothetical protein V8E54_009417 [Elaphomyces granulatus]